MKGILWISLCMFIIGGLAGWFSQDIFNTQVTPTQTLMAPAAQPKKTRTAIKTPTIASISPTVQTAKNLNIPETETELDAFRQLLKKEEFSKALSMWPQWNNTQARNDTFRLVNSLQQQHRVEQALLFLNEYSSYFPDDLEAGLMQANILEQQKQFDQEAFLLIELQKRTTA